MKGKYEKKKEITNYKRMKNMERAKQLTKKTRRVAEQTTKVVVKAIVSAIVFGIFFC